MDTKTYKLKKNRNLEVILGKQIHYTPKYTYFDLTINLTSAKHFEELCAIEESHVGTYVSYYSGEKGRNGFYFDPIDLELNSVELAHSLKEKKPKNYFILKDIKSTKGILKWQKGQESFHLKETKFRHLDKTTNTLLSYGKKFLKSTAISLKLEIAKDIFILFNQDNMFCGWQMKNPETYIVQYYYYRQEYDPYVNFKSEKPHPRLKEFYYKTHKLYEQKKLDLVDNTYEDPERKLLLKFIKLYYDMDDLKNPCIGIIALKEKLHHIIYFGKENRALFDSYKK